MCEAGQGEGVGMYAHCACLFILLLLPLLPPLLVTEYTVSWPSNGNEDQ